MKNITIVGMHCSGCTSRVEKALKAFGSNKVDLKGGYAEVDTTAADNDLKNAVEDLGFDVTKIETV